MKRILNLVLLLVLLFCAVGTPASISGPRGFDGRLWAGVMALYAETPRGLSVCTARPYEKIPGGYRLISAGHCVIADAKYSIAAEPGEKTTPVMRVKSRFDENYDFSIFELKTDIKYPVIGLGSDTDLRVGDEVIDANFTLGLGKQLSTGHISSTFLLASHHCPDTCIGSFLVQLSGAGPGASGSAVVSKRTHKIIGILTQEFEGENAGFVVEPVSRFRKFLTQADAPEVATITIPGDVFQGLFGAEHPFALAVHGPNPVFTQAGYTFKTDTDGFELADEYYYDVPVFIGVDENGYHLVTTAEEGFAVNVTIIGQP